jgi:hypothetical protein
MNAPLKQARSVEESSRGLGAVAAPKRAQSPKETVLTLIGRDPEQSHDEELLQQSASSFGDNPHISDGNYLPSGVMLATILKALRESGDNQLEIQQQQAAAEQLFDRELGGLNGDVRKGIIAMAAQSVVNAGNDEADGLMAQGVSSAVNAAVSGLTTALALGNGLKNTYKTDGTNDLDKQMDEVKADGQKLDGIKQGDLLAADANKPIDEDLAQGVDRGGLDKQGKPVHDEIEAIKMSPKELESAKDANKEKLKDLKEKQQKLNDSTSQGIQTNQAVVQVVSSATGAYGSIQQSQAKAAAAADNASAQVQKQVQDMNYSAANTFKENAKAAAQQAFQAADLQAQVAQSQVQVRG